MRTSDTAASYSGRGAVLLRRPARAALPGDRAGDHRRQFLALPAQPFAEVFRRWYPMAVHLLEGLFIGSRNIARAGRAAGTAARAGQADRRAHPRAEQPGGRGGPRHRRAARAVRRHAAQARRCCRRASSTARCCARSPACRRSSSRRIGGARRPVRRWSGRTARTCSATGSRSTSDPAVGAGRGVRRRRARRRRPRAGGRRRGAVLPGAGAALAGATPSRPRPCSPRSPTAPSRISHLVDAAKQYSQMDRTPHQQTDLHAGLDATLVMLSAKIPPGVTVVKEYDRSLPKVPAYAGELNQVWTNLIVNALDAMGERGPADAAHRHGRRLRGGGDRRHRARASPRSCAAGCSSRSSRPSRSGRAPAWAWTSRGGSWSSGTAATCGSTSEPGDTRFTVVLPLTEPAAPA